VTATQRQSKALLKKSTNGRFMPLRLAALRAGLKAVRTVSPDAAAAWAERLFTTPLRFEQPAAERDALRGGRFFRLDVAPELTPEFAGEPLTLATWTFGDGPLVVLAHGWSGRGGQLHRFIAPLVAAGFTVLVFDAPGHGQSGGRRVSLVDFARSILAIDRALGPVHAVVAHSMGGAAAALAVREGLALQSLVTIGAPADAEDAVKRFRAVTDVDDATLLAMEKRLESRYARALADLDVKSGVPAPRALVIHDAGDKDVPFHYAESLAAALPGAELIRTEGLGHRRILRDAGIVSRVVAFLSAGRGDAVAPRDEHDLPFRRML
jgi:pimeloyl-ACP methyl ester carboxylesterase